MPHLRQTVLTIARPIARTTIHGVYVLLCTLQPSSALFAPVHGYVQATNVMALAEENNDAEDENGEDTDDVKIMDTPPRSKRVTGKHYDAL